MKARCHVTHTRPAVSAQRRGALGQVCSIPGSAFQSVSSDSCGCCQRAVDGDTGTAPLHADGDRAELRPQRAFLQHHPTIMASHASCQRHTGAPASRGIWKHLKLPRRRPGALRARPHTRLEHCSDPLREPAEPYGHSRPVGSLAGPLSKPTGPPNAKRIGTTACTVSTSLAKHQTKTGVRRADYVVPEQSLLPVADALSLTDGGEVGDCLQPGFQTHCCQALECSQCSSTAALLAFG